VVERGRNNLLTDLLFASEQVDNTAHDVVFFAGRDGDAEGDAAWRAALAAVTPDDVRRVAARWLVDPTVVVLAEDAPTTLPVRTAHAERQVRVMRASPEDAGLDRSAIASLYLAWSGGVQAEDPSTAGVTDAWALAVTTGAGSLGSVALAAELDRHGASLRAVAGRSSVGLQLTAPVGGMDAAIDVLADVVRAPRFEASEWERLQDEQLLDLDTLDDRPDEVLHRRLWSLAWKGHPWAVQRSRTQIRGLRTEAFEAFHGRWITRGGLVVGVAGPVHDRVPAWLDRLLVGLPDDPPSFTPPELGPQPEGHFTSSGGSEQAIVVAATRTPSLHHAHTAALRVAVGLLGAQSGPLFLDLRERRSLAYSVFARMAEAPTAGLLTVGLATDPARKGVARRALLDAMARVADEGPTDAELARTKAMVLGQLAAAHQSAAGRAVGLALAGLYGVEPGTDAVRREIAAVDRQAVKDALGALAPLFTVTVAPG
ncbi:MAG: insulinase family protein, partial [Myxococcales bacterium]|nr:insulinase family protein [Myxococcales bacterium]